LYCGELFAPDPRNVHHQKYCGLPPCRKASKAASQRRWLAKPPNRDYFRGPEQVERVRRWRAKHPGYWRRSALVKPPLQDLSITQVVDSTDKLGRLTLQEVLDAQAAVLIGVIANLMGTTLQDDIAEKARFLRQLGSDVLAVPSRGGFCDEQTPIVPRAAPACSPSVQLG